MPARKPVDLSKPYTPAAYSKFDVYALKALQSGTANPAQQQRALAWIINQCAKTYDLPYHPGGEEGRRDSDFASGKVFVGQQIVKLLNYDAALLNQLKD